MTGIQSCAEFQVERYCFAIVLFLSFQVKTAALSADLPIICSMLSRLFQSSQYLSEKALMHLIQALCQLSAETEASTSRVITDFLITVIPTMHLKSVL